MILRRILALSAGMILAGCLMLHAQYERKVDSIKALLAQPQPDTLRISRLNDIARMYNLIAPDSSLNYTFESIRLAEKAGYTIGLGRAYINLGISYDNLGRLREALSEFDKATDLLENTPHTRVLSSAYTNRGIVYNELGRYDSALICYQKSIELKDSVKDVVSIGIVYTNIGVAYSNLGDQSKALDYFIKSRTIAEKEGDLQGIADNNLNISDTYFTRNQHKEALQILEETYRIQQELGDKEGFCYTKEAMGNNYCRLGNYDKAFALFDEALQIAREMQLLLRIGTVEQSMGDCYAMRKDYGNALKHYANSQEANTQLGERKSLILNHNSMGRMKLITGRYEDALDEFLNAARLAEESHYLAGLSEAYQGIAETYEQSGDYKNAYAYFVKKSAVNDSLHNESETRHLMLLQVQFETERKDREIDLLNARADLEESQRRKAVLLRNVFIVGFLAALGILALLISNVKRKQRTNALLKEKNEIIRKQKQQVEEALHQLKKSQSQLIQAEKMASLGQLTAGVAHEINNPINFVSANVNPLKRNFDELVQVLKERRPGDETGDLDYLINESIQLLSGIEEGSRRTAEIVKGLRTFSRADEGDLKSVDVHEGIESSLLILNNKLRHQQIAVEKNFAPLPPVLCYPGQLNQVWMNLLSNAIDAIGENGTITITSSQENGKACISIRDTGKGISDDIIKKIFDPFFTTKEVGQGTGLGLSISYGIIKKHHGEIHVTSKKGEGAEFIVTLPLSV